MNPTERLFEQDAYVTEGSAIVTSATSDSVRLDRSLFYAESGGQPGDQGELVVADGRIVRIAATNYAPGRLSIIHAPERSDHGLSEGDEVRMRIDWPRRYAHMRMHTCLHILSGLIPAPITGCAIHAAHGRLDFDLEENTIDKVKLGEDLNRIIADDIAVDVLTWPVEEVRRCPDLVRTAAVAPPDIGDSVRIIRIGETDLQPCGGTHVRRTGEIGPVVVRKVEKKSRHNRRVTIAFAETAETE